MATLRHPDITWRTACFQRQLMIERPYIRPRQDLRESASHLDAWGKPGECTGCSNRWEIEPAALSPTIYEERAARLPL